MKTTKTYWFLYFILVILVLSSFTSCSPDDEYQDCKEWNETIDFRIKELRTYDKYSQTTIKQIDKWLALKQDCN